MDIVRAAGITVILGNCDENLGSGAGSCGCGFGDGTACDALSQQWYVHAEAHVDAMACDWMAGLPEAATFTMAGRNFRVVHGGVGQINRFVYASSPTVKSTPRWTPPKRTRWLAGIAVCLSPDA